MHTLLENYLAEVAAHLSVLPTKQRTEELREMRAHLENAVVVSRELGQTEDEAAQNVVAQFGTPEDLGANVIWAWRRGKTLNTKSFFGAVVSTLMLTIIVSPSVMLLMGHFVAEDVAFWLTRNFIAFALIGAGTGLLFPKRAVAGTAFVLGGLILWDTADFFQFNTPFPQVSCRWMEYVLVNLFRCRLVVDAPTISAIVAAWGVSRWRTTAERSRRAARL